MEQRGGEWEHGGEPQAGGRLAQSGGLRLAEFSVRYPVTICMIFVTMIVLGIVSGFKIPLVLLPSVDFPGLFVFVPYRNATPSQIQQSITKPLEEVLATIPGVQRMSSQSSADSARVQMFFDWGIDVEFLRAEVREKVDQIRNDLPEDVEQIMIRNWSTDDQPILFGQISTQTDLRNSYDLLDLKVKQPLERVPGVAEVELWGAQRREVDIYLRLDALKRHRVNVDQLFRRLDSLNMNTSLGRVEDGGTRYGALAAGTIGSLEDIREIPVNDKGLTLSHIADIYLDTPPANSGRHLNGAYALGFAIRKTSQANTVDTVARILDEIEELNRDPGLRGVNVLVWQNAGEEITKSLFGLLESGVVGAILAVVVLIFFLRKLGATIIIALAIPFSVIASVGALYFAGYTLNVLTMMGLMLSTGMLVDNAVVVLESIYQKLEKGQDRITAARIGTQEVITAVVASTLTSIIIFLPLVFGKVTEFSIWLGQAGAAIMLALSCSLFISLTLIPLAMAKLLRFDGTERPAWQKWLIARLAALSPRLHGRLHGNGAPRLAPERTAMGYGPITEAYLKMVIWPLNHRLLIGLLVVPLMVAGSTYWLMKKVPDNTPEASELGNLQISYKFSENYHYAKIERDYVIPVENYILEHKEKFKVKDVQSWYGNDQANTQIYFDKDRVTAADMKQIREDLKKGLPVIPGATIEPGRQQGAQNSEWISVSLNGDDPETLQALAQEGKRRLLMRPDVTEVYDQLDRAQEEVQIKLNRDLARKYNVSPQSVSGVLAVVVRGRQVRSFPTPQGEVEIWVKMHPDDLGDLSDLKSIVVGSGPGGEEIQLSQVAEFRLEKTPGTIEREDRRTNSQLWVVYNGQKKEEGRELVSNVMDSLNFPMGYGWSFGFWTQRQSQENTDFVFNILMALFMVYFVMASLFESLAHPFSIMFSLPFGVVGVAWFLYFTNTPFNMMAWIGMMVLIGVVVNNGIVLIDHVNNLRRSGMVRRMAIIEGCRERLRPIAMTAGTTIVGLIPLAWGDAGLFNMKYFPLARTVMGGMLSSTLLTLIVLPTYYSLVDDCASWMKRTWFSTAAGRPAEAGPEAVAEPAPASGD